MTTGNRHRGRFHLLPHPGGQSLRYFLKEMFSSFMDDDITGRAAQLAFYFFFAIFPGFIFLSSLADIVSAGGDGVRSIVLRHLSTAVPPQANGLLQDAFDRTGHHAGGLTFGVIVALWSATFGMSAVCDTLNGVQDVNESRPWWKVQLTAFALTMITTVLVLCAIGALFAGDDVIQTAGPRFASGPLWLAVKVVQWLIVLVLMALIFGITYYLGPDVEHREWHWITPGASIGILLWVAASLGLRYYVNHFGSYSSTYGSIGAVMILLLWFYVAGFALLTGGEVNAVLEDLAAQKGDPEALGKGERAPGRAAQGTTNGMAEGE
jgi:membrane protein